MGRFIFVSFGLLVVFLSLRGTGAGFCCPFGWSSYEGYCYKVHNKKMNWADAESFCREQHKRSHLVSFHSSGEVDFVVSKTFPILRYDFVWMGLSDIWKECTKEWSDGARLDYKAWSGKSYCLVSKTTNNEWLSMDCSRTLYPVCKFKA